MGFIPFLKFKMYDVGVEKLASADQTVDDLWKHINFRIAWISKDYTETQ